MRTTTLSHRRLQRARHYTAIHQSPERPLLRHDKATMNDVCSTTSNYQVLNRDQITHTHKCERDFHSGVPSYPAKGKSSLHKIARVGKSQRIQPQTALQTNNSTILLLLHTRYNNNSKGVKLDYGRHRPNLSGERKIG